MSLRLPALRERSGDILPLAHRAMQACARGSQASLALVAGRRAEAAAARLAGQRARTHEYRAARGWLAVGGLIDAADLDINIPADAAQADAISQPAPAPAAAQEVGLDHDLKERERELIFATLRVTGGSRKLAAERLGISPRTLRHKLQQLKAAGINVPRLPIPSSRRPNPMSSMQIQQVLSEMRALQREPQAARPSRRRSPRSLRISRIS